MLAPSTLPDQFRAWNEAYGAPFGHQWPKSDSTRRLLPAKFLHRLRGPFSIQKNSTTRTFEYPWAYHAAELKGEMTIAEIGGGLSGLQFVLGREGHEVVNIDPGTTAADIGWPCDDAHHAKLNGWFGTDVTLKKTTIGAANLPDDHFDLFIAISVLEHLTEIELREVLLHSYRCLKSGGRFIVTVDLFLNLRPFSRRTQNQWGGNHDVGAMIESSRLTLIRGERSELYGCPEFDAEAILANLERYFIGNYPVLTQCMVLQKP